MSVKKLKALFYKGYKFINLDDINLLTDTWEPEENWSPLGTKANNSELVLDPEEVSYYNGELLRQPRQRWTKEELLEILDSHPMFTGRCPECEMPYPKDYRPDVHWDCPFCEWKDDSV